MAFYYPGFMNSTYSYTFNTFNRFKYKGNINLNEINYKSETAFDLYFSNRVDSDELIKNVFFINTETGEKEKLPIKYGYRYSSKSYYIYHELLPKTQYFIEINKGLKDIFDNNIENPGTYSIKTGNYYPFIQFDDYYLYTIDPPLLHINGMNWNFCDIYIDFLSTMILSISIQMILCLKSRTYLSPFRKNVMNSLYQRIKCTPFQLI